MAAHRNAGSGEALTGTSEIVQAEHLGHSEGSTNPSQFQRFAIGPVHVGDVLRCVGLSHRQLAGSGKCVDVDAFQFGQKRHRCRFCGRTS